MVTPSSVFLSRPREASATWHEARGTWHDARRSTGTSESHGTRHVEPPEHQPHGTTQQRRYINPMLVQCWASVVDGGPTLDQHWVSSIIMIIRVLARGHGRLCSINCYRKIGIMFGCSHDEQVYLANFSGPNLSGSMNGCLF